MVRASVPSPDPTVLTTAALQREIAATREIIEGHVSSNTRAIESLNDIFIAKLSGNTDVITERLSGMDKAIELLQKATDKFPQQIIDAVNRLQELHEEKFNSIYEQIKIQFSGIGVQFNERDKRTEQLSLADKTAIAAALQAQKEAAGATNESNSVALSKMENNFAKLIDQTQTLLNSSTRNTDEKISDVKSRLDRGEGRTSVSDPEVANGLSEMKEFIRSLATSRDSGAGAADSSRRQTTTTIAAIAMVGAIIVAVIAMINFTGRSSASDLGKIVEQNTQTLQALQQRLSGTK